MSDRTKKYASRTAHGLSAAAILFLYTNFVPRKEYDRLEARYDKVVETMMVQQASLAVLQSIHAQRYE